MEARNSVGASSPLVRTLNSLSSGQSFAFLYITNECQLNCAHCSFQSGPSQHHTRIDEKKLSSVLDELQGVRDITITGGEPMLHPSFQEIALRAAERARVVYVMTNGVEVVGKEKLRDLAKHGRQSELVKNLKERLTFLPNNVHLFFPLDSFHLKTYRPFSFLIQALAELARQWNQLKHRPFIGFLSNEISRKKSEELIDRFAVRAAAHIGTACFAPWRKSRHLEEWYFMHPLNRTPFAGGLYINFKGVYRNEAALLMDLRENRVTELKIGTLDCEKNSNTHLAFLLRSALNN